MKNELLRTLKRLVRTPVVTVVSLITITLAFAANVAVFSVVDGVLLRPLPFSEPERLVRVLNHPEDNPDISFEVSYPEFLEVREGVEGFSDVAGHASTSGGLEVRIEDRLERLPGAIVSSNLFSVLGAEPLLGEPWQDSDGVIGAEPVVAISERLWQSHFRADRALLGRYLEIEGQQHRVNAIYEAAFEYPSGAELWIPTTSALPASLLESAQTRFFNPVARLADHAALDATIEEWNRLIDRTTDSQLPESARSEISAIPLRADLSGASRATLFFLWGAAGLVLVIAGANVLNLQTVRALSKKREAAVRRALGASTGDLARLTLSETLLLSLIGSVLGTLLGIVVLDLLLRASPVELYRAATLSADSLSLDARAWGFALTLSILSAFVLSIGPLFALRRQDVAQTIKEGGASLGGTTATRTLLRGFVIAQATIAVVLALAGSLLLNSYLRLSNEDPGFDRKRVLSFSLAQSPTDAAGVAASPDQQDDLIERLVDTLEDLPAVESAGAVLIRPLNSLQGFDSIITIEGRPPEESATYPQLNYEIATPGYFKTLGIPLLEGRLFDRHDDEEASPAAVISQAVARRFFEVESPVGQRFRFGGADATGPWVEIVGVIGEGRYRTMEQVSLDVFVPHRQGPWPLNHLVVSSKQESPEALSSEIRRAIAETRAGVEATGFETLQKVVSRSLASPRFETQLIGLFAGLALLLGAVGLYGVMSYLLSVRHQELGLRMAIGATPRDVFKLIFNEAALLASIGIVSGLLLALVLMRVASSTLASNLYGITATDPLSAAIAIAVFACVAALAGIPPALRARRVDPREAMSDR